MSSRGCTIGLLCPLSRELDAVLASFDDGFVKDRDETEGRETTYYRGQLAKQEVVAVCLPKGDIGADEAGAYAARLQTRYPSLQLRFLVGIAGGNPEGKNDIRLGDVVIGTKVVNYRKGHVVENGKFKSNAYPFDAPQTLLDGLNDPTWRSSSTGRHLEETLGHMNTNYRRHIARDPDSGERWVRPTAERDVLFQHDYNHKKPNASDCEACDQRKLVKRTPREKELPEIHYGLVASAGHVLKDGKTRNNLKDYFDEILAIEMEASALKDYNYIVVRGICDYADTHKNDEWQDYAAATAAACARILAKSLSGGHSEVDSHSELEEPVPANSDLPTTGTSPDSERVDAERVDTERVGTEPVATHPYTDPVERTKVRSYKSVNVDLHKRDAGGKDKDKDAALGECELILWHCEGRELHQTHRRLDMVNNASNRTNTTSLWLPLTNILVNEEGSVLTVRFSDCNQLGWVNGYRTEQGRNQYTPVYNPDSPNVRVKLEFREAGMANDFANKLLDSSHITKTQPMTEFTTVHDKPARLYVLPHSRPSSPVRLVLTTVCRREYKCPREDKKTTNQKLVVCFIDDQLDFHINSYPQAVAVTLERCLEATYCPRHQISAHWPPDLVQNNEDGSPARVELKRSTGSKAVSVRLSHDDATRFLQTLIPGWQLQLPEFNVQFRSHFGRWVGKGNFGNANLTIWRSDSQCRSLVRDPAVSNTTRSKWYSCTLQARATERSDRPPSDSPRSDSPPPEPPSLEIDPSENIITLSRIEQYKGDFLLRTTSDIIVTTEIGQQNGENENANSNVVPSEKSKPLTQDFKFGKREEMDRFLELLEPFVERRPSPPPPTRSTSMSVERTSTQQSGKKQRRSTLTSIWRQIQS